jgi:NAD(P)-dependent dehydrogenase (short-subunit alcohol dehydrogenase family)
MLAGKVAVVTAAGSGMGRASAIRLAEDGAAVVVADIDEAAARETVDAIRDAGGRAEPFQIDVGDVARIAELFSFVDAEFGRLDVVFSHAGIPGPAGLDVTEDEYDRTMAINQKSAFFVTKHAMPLLERADRASIIYTASTSGVAGSPSSPLYSLAKGGIVVFAKSVALMHAPKVRANVIAPGPVDTPMLPKFLGRQEPEKAEEILKTWVSGSIPLQRRCTPEEIAEAVLYLASDRSAFVTGIVLPVDGGYLAR